MSTRRLNRQRMFDQGHRRWLEERDIEMRKNIIAAIPATIRAEGFAAVRFSLVADGFGITVRRLRNMFADRDEMLFHILRNYLNDILDSFARARGTNTGADLARGLRAAYHRLAHEGFQNGLSTRHSILLRETNMLPPDLREGLEETMRQIWEMIERDPYRRTLVMGLLDSPFVSIEAIETVLAGGLSALQPPEDPAWQPEKPPVPPSPVRKITYPQPEPSGSVALLPAPPDAPAPTIKAPQPRAGP